MNLSKKILDGVHYNVEELKVLTKFRIIVFGIVSKLVLKS